MGTPLALLLSLSAVWFGLSTAKVNAQLDREGPVSMTYLASSLQIIIPISINVDKELMLSVAKLFTSNDASKGFLHHIVGRCVMIGMVDKAAKTFEQHGYCSYVDADGDSVWENVDSDQQPFDAVFAAKGEWVWGTGKYRGIEGSVEIRHLRIESATEGVMRGFGTQKGSYKLYGKG